MGHLSEKLEGILIRIREVPGHENFMKTTPYSVLKSVADEGPVIIICASRHRSDVIILIKDCSLMHIPSYVIHLKSSGVFQRRS